MKKIICVILCVYCLILYPALYVSLIAQDSDTSDSSVSSVLKGYVSKIPSGTKLRIILETPIDEVTSMIDDEVTARTAEDIVIGESVVVSAGSTVVGSISEINFAKRLNRAGNVRIDFKSLTMPDGRQLPIVASVLSRSGLIKGKYTKKTALISGAKIIAPAAVGFGVGLAAEGSALGATIGAALGTLAGITLYAFQKGNMVDIKAGDEMDIELVEEAIVPSVVDEGSNLMIDEEAGINEMDFTESAPEMSKLEPELIEPLKVEPKEEAGDAVDMSLLE